MRQLFALTLILTAVTAIGCGPNSSTPTATVPEATTAVTAEPKPSEVETATPAATAPAATDVAASDTAATLPAVYVQEGVAIAGADPVAYFTEGTYVPGSDQFTHDWSGATWYFSSAEHRDTFASDPTAYAPQYGGFCAWAVSQGYTAAVDPEAWKVVDGKLYLNFNKSIQSRWERDIPGNIAQADANWPEVAAAE